MEERKDQRQADAIADNVSCSRFNELAQKGIKYAIINIDALCAKGECDVKGTAGRVLEFEKGRGNLEKFCVLSELVSGNIDRTTRLYKVVSVLDAQPYCFFRVRTPKPEQYISEAIRILGSSPENTVLITNDPNEIEGGNLLGMYTILVPAPEQTNIEPERLNNGLVLQKA